LVNIAIVWHEWHQWKGRFPVVERVDREKSMHKGLGFGLRPRHVFELRDMSGKLQFQEPPYLWGDVCHETE
jgi:hypothetical protein